MKEQFERVELEVISFEGQDVIVTSGGSEWDG